MSDGDPSAIDRRAYLASVAGAGAASLAGCSLFDTGDDGEVSTVDDDRARTLAERFAPTLYFDEHERWFPTDPRPYESERDSETVIDGFDALKGYVDRGGADDPPAPTGFYNVVEYEESPLTVVQFWFYSAFDQFTANFHWHDWELLQVFVDTDTEEPQLHVASSHSRKVPNNEFLDPERTRSRILSELGSHSSGLSVNDDAEHFQRLPLDGSVADITNSVIDGIDAVAAIPLAYGLPRDEGFGLPYAVPELDGAPFYEDDRLPSVDASNLIPEELTVRSEELTVRSLEGLRSPPELSTRETGYRFDYRDAQVEGTDVAYDLRPSSDLEHIDDFVGPQLSFEFSVPAFAENAVASHITTAGVPWADPRYENPATDITEPVHRQALADRYDAIGQPSPVSQVVAGVTNAVSDEDAPEDEGVTTVPSPLEMFALLRSDPEAVPTFNGVAVLNDVPAGDHELTINGAGVAPHAETVTVAEGEATAAGVEGEIPVVARENAVKVEIDPSEADSELRALAVEDDFAGRMYDAQLSGPDAVYVHGGGAYTTELRDENDEIGAFRVNPGDEARVRMADPRTGKSSLAEYLADVVAETRDEIAAIEDDDRQGGGRANSVTGLANALDAVADAAQRAAEAADNGNRGRADRSLDNVIERLRRVQTRLSEASESLPDGLARATSNRLEQADRQSDQAKNAEKL